MPLRENVEVSLVSIGSSKQPVDQPPKSPETANFNTQQSRQASVLYLANYCDDSYVDVSLVRDLFRAVHGPEAPIPYMDTSTWVTLQCRLTPLDEAEVTTHRVLRDSRHQIILRKQDWELPIRKWLQHEGYQREKQQRQDVLAANDQPQQRFGEEDQRFKMKPRIDSLHLTQDNAPLSPAPSEWDEDENADSDFEWSEIEIIESRPSEHGSKQTDPNAFWIWSGEHQSWFHENEDQTVTWFPGLE